MTEEKLVPPWAPDVSGELTSDSCLTGESQEDWPILNGQLWLMEGATWPFVPLASKVSLWLSWWKALFLPVLD